MKFNHTIFLFERGSNLTNMNKSSLILWIYFYLCHFPLSQTYSIQFIYCKPVEQVMLDTNIYRVMRNNTVLLVDSVGDSIIRYIFVCEL